MKPFLRSGVLFLMMLLPGACGLPRGAALQSEIVNESRDEAPSFSVVEVTRATLPGITGWPATGPHQGRSWIGASQAPSSRMIKPGDRIDLVIWDSQENSLLAPSTSKMVSMPGLQVSPTGRIFVPYIDQVEVTGKSPEAARADIQARLVPIAPSAQVQLSVSAGEDNTVDLVGGVAKPGRYPLTDRGLSILSLLAEGGGIAPGLRNPLVRLQRSGSAYEIAAEDLFSQPAQNTLLRGGDRVIIESDPRYFVALGATGTEDLVYFEKDEISTLDALSMIGGLSDSRADLKGVMVLREYPAGTMRSDGTGPEMPQVIFTFDLTSADGLFAARKFRINAEDVVLATESRIPAASTLLGLFGTTLGISQRL